MSLNEYAEVKEAHDTCELRNWCDYHDIYLAIDVFGLADNHSRVFSKFVLRVLYTRPGHNPAAPCVIPAVGMSVT